MAIRQLKFFRLLTMCKGQPATLARARDKHPVLPMYPVDTRLVSLTDAKKEAVRLVIWDLDETFWRGTLSEGGITEYIEAHHDIVIELARRGIMSSICSKNDFATIQQILNDKGLWDYFIFPSINWSPKGPRIAELVEAVQLRASTILFIDDNPSNRAEALAAVPELQVADEANIPEILESPLFRGKDDRNLTRLGQYKLLEKRKADQACAGGNSIDFLRKSNIRVQIEAEIEPYLDRAIELIARTNQLNFTKTDLPDNHESARAELLTALRTYWYQAGLVRVFDNYGDYGFCGFFLKTAAQGSGSGKLIHYCFSCRILGMGVETWLYDKLGRPALRVQGEVLTDPTEETPVDWIELATKEDVSPAGAGLSAEPRRIPAVRLRGGCETDALAHYFSLGTNSCQREGSVNRGQLFVHKDCSHHLSAALSELEPSFAEAIAALGFSAADFKSEFFAPAEPGTLLVYCGWGDIEAPVYRHRATGRNVTVKIHGFPGDLARESSNEINSRILGKGLNDEASSQIRQIIRILKDEFQYHGKLTESEIKIQLKAIFDAIPSGCRLIALAADEYYKHEEKLTARARAIAYNRWLREAADRYDNVSVIGIRECIQDEAEHQATDHFDRIVYYRLARGLLHKYYETLDASGGQMRLHASP